MIFHRITRPTKSRKTEYWEATCERCGHVFPLVRVKASIVALHLHLSDIVDHIHLEEMKTEATDLERRVAAFGTSRSSAEAKKTLHVTDGSKIMNEHSTYLFRLETKGRGLRRVFPTKFRHGDEAGAASHRTMTKWFKRIGVTHVTSTFDNKKTDECCIADGTYTAAEYLKWWGQLEGLDA